MDEAFDSFDHNELSPEDLEVLRAFHAIDEPGPASSPSQEPAQGASTTPQPGDAQSSSTLSEDDMLALFAMEADEDITTMRSALQQIEQDDRVGSPGFVALQRAAHKVAGTAGAIGCDSMSAIARSIEKVIKLVRSETVAYLTGLIALAHAVRALESTLHSVVANGYESKSSLLELEEEYKALDIDIHAVDIPENPSHDTAEDTLFQMTSPARIDQLHLDQLIQHTEKLVELHIPLKNAQKEVETALYELQAAQARLRRLEPLLSSMSLSLDTPNNDMSASAEHPASSLVVRILNEAVERTGRIQQFKSKSLPQPLAVQDTALWDEMEIDRFTETGVLAHSLSEAIADIATATTRLRLAFAHLRSVVERRLIQTGIVHNDALLLRSMPFSVLLTLLQQAVEMLVGAQTGAQKGKVQFEASGEMTMIDQDILEALTDPLLEFVRSSVAESLFLGDKSEQDGEQVLRISLKVHAIGNEVTIEISFSQPVSPGVLDALRQQAIQQLYGSVSTQQQAGGQTDVCLRFPRSQRVVQGLLVRAGDQCVIIPFSQIQHIDYSEQPGGKTLAQGEHPQETSPADWQEVYDLAALLGFSPENAPAGNVARVALVLQAETPHMVVQADEVVGEIELVMKPLAAHLHRPGIAGAAIDGSGNVLLIVNLPEILRLQAMQGRNGEVVPGRDVSRNHKVPPAQHKEQLLKKILVADDSVYIRQSISQTLSHEGYEVLEADDGVKALEQLAKETPGLLLLDIEMPNLNGYDVLNILRTSSQFPELKIVLLTSRSSEKHKQRALELGAHAYLTKPCPQDLLLKTIQSLLN